MSTKIAGSKVPKVKKEAVVKVIKTKRAKTVEEPRQPVEPALVEDKEVEKTEVTDVDQESKNEVVDEKVEKPKRNRSQKVSKQIYDDVSRLLDLVEQDLGNPKLDKTAEKCLKRYQKQLIALRNRSQKIQRSVKKAEPTVKNTQSGFSKPLKITEEMSEFAGWPAGELKSRTDVNTALCNYIKTHNLQLETDKRKIVPDEKLGKLLRYNQEQHGTLDFAKMQKFLKPLFVIDPVSA